MRVVVSGATSMIGIACIKACIENHCEVLAIVRKNTKRIGRLPQSDLVKLAYADLETISCVQGDGTPYDVFYHFAWSHTSRTERNDPVAQTDNIRTTLQAVELAHRLGCRKFIGAGSQAEYGPVEGIISADTRPEPVVAYGMAKLSANLLSRKLCEQYGMQHIWGRIFSVYGIHDNDGTMLNYAFDKFLKGEVAEFSAATQMWNYLYEDDAGMMFYLLGKENVKPGIYCIAHTESQRLKTYIRQMQTAFDEQTKCKFASADPAVKTVSLEVDMQKTVEAIGYVPRVSFAEGIACILRSKRAEEGAVQN